MKISFYKNVAKNTFINGITDHPYHLFLTHCQLNDIEDCINKYRRHDNHEQQTNFFLYMCNAKVNRKRIYSMHRVRRKLQFHFNRDPL